MARKSRGWLTIVYPESSNILMVKNILSQIGQQAVISPVHDKDINQGTNELKKAHYHILLLWDGPTTERNAKYTVGLINGVGCIPCASIRGSVRYFCHLDNPDKVTYDVKDLDQIGGLDLRKLLISANDQTLLLTEIYNFIRKQKIDSYSDFIDYCTLYNDEWLYLVNNMYRENVFKYIRSIEYDNRRGHEAKYENVRESAKSI